MFGILTAFTSAHACRLLIHPLKSILFEKNTEMSRRSAAGGLLWALLKRSTGFIMNVAADDFIVVSHIFCPWKHEKVLAATCNETLVFLILLNILVCVMCSYHSANMRWRKMQHPKCGLKINEYFRKMLHVYVHITANMKINSNLTHSRDTLLGKTAF